MITVEQCRAARALLGWTQQDLADACGLSKTAINNFETEHSDIKSESLRAIRLAFESLDIEFLEDQGLKKRRDKVDIFKGPHALTHLIDDIYLSLKDTGGEVLVSNPDDKFFTSDVNEKWCSIIETAKGKQIHSRVITTPSQSKKYGTAAIGTKDNRHIIEANMAKVLPMAVIYSNKTAFKYLNSNIITITTSQQVSDSERTRFELLWDISKESNVYQSDTTAKTA